MKKTILPLLTVLLFTTSCIAQVFAPAQITFKVKDDFGKPIPGIKVRASTYDHTKSGDSFGEAIFKDFFAITDQQGLAIINGSSKNGEFMCGAPHIEGYYFTAGPDYQFTEIKNGRWEPSNPMIELVFKPILNPVAMYAASQKQLRLQEPDHKYGYDLMTGDWISPEGKGQTADLFFEVVGYWKTAFDHDTTLIVTFANKGDGIQAFEAGPINVGSEFRSPRQAPISGYQSELRLRKARFLGQKYADQIEDTMGDHNYFFRVRTVLDEKGKVKSAYYGKIEQGMDFGGAAKKSFLLLRSYFLNPESNSRNMEFDPKRNLLSPEKPKKK